MQSKQAISNVCLVHLLRSVADRAIISATQHSSQVTSMGIPVHSTPYMIGRQEVALISLKICALLFQCRGQAVGQLVEALRY